MINLLMSAMEEIYCLILDTVSIVLVNKMV